MPLSVPLIDKHISTGARMGEFAGYQMPLWYSSIVEEHAAVRDKVGIFDTSHMGEIFVEGEDAHQIVDLVSTNSVDSLYEGQCQYSFILNDDGTVIDDLLVYRCEPDKFLLVVNAGKSQLITEQIKKHSSGMSVTLTDVTLDLAMFAIQGPLSEAVYKELFADELLRLPYYYFVTRNHKGKEIYVSRTGYTGERGFEVFVDKSIANDLWDEIVSSKAAKVQPCGLGARDILRLEAGLPLCGNDLDKRTPIEANLKRFVDMTKADFVGKKALEEMQVTEVLKKFKFLEKGIPRHDYIINDASGNTIGKVTSGGFSPILDLGIGMGYISKAYLNDHNEIYIDIRGSQKKAEVVKSAFITSKAS